MFSNSLKIITFYFDTKIENKYQFFVANFSKMLVLMYSNLCGW